MSAAGAGFVVLGLDRSFGWIVFKTGVFLRCAMRFFGVVEAGQFVVDWWWDVVLWWALILAG
jgi:hypothetical protein